MPGVFARWAVTFYIGLGASLAFAADLGEVSRYHLIELTFEGPELGPRDTPARDVELTVTFRHESGTPSITVPGFWDGDGKGAAQGKLFKVRFCPTKTGRWTVAQTESNRRELAGQREGDSLVCIESDHPGFWIADGSWFARSDGSRPYIVGNTQYTFLSGRRDDGPTEVNPADDIRANAEYYKKLRFSLMPCRYPDPDLKPFLDERGRQTDDGRHSMRPNPRWFRERVDPAVQAGFETDLICDLILCGPDTREARSTLLDPQPWLRYVAARYGSYPNVWICLANEWDIKNPRYTVEQILAAGRFMKETLPYPTPLSVHRDGGDWKQELNGDWHSHVIIQGKRRTIPDAADMAAKNLRIGNGKPVVNDENAYQGEGDNFTHDDTVEGCFGTFLGGGYPTTGEKYASKLGQYFWGGFDPKIHSATEHLELLRRYVDEHVEFWELAPLKREETPFAALANDARVLGREGREYVVGTNRRHERESIDLPSGRWRITQIDLLGKTTVVVADDASGRISFHAPESRAVLTHFRRVD